MMFVTISPKQAAQYSYMCIQLRQMVNKMYTARKTLEGLANTSFDKSFAKCVYLLISESQQCENEIRAQIDSLNCNNYEHASVESGKSSPATPTSRLESIYEYCEEAYLHSYKKLLRDKHLSKSIKSLIQNQLQLFMSSLTQLRLFLELKIAAN